MSYDLSVFAPEGLPPAEILDIVHQIPGLQPLPDLGDGTAEVVRVGRGARRDYCFTVEGPFKVEMEDLPERVTAAVVGAKALYQVQIEGSPETAVPLANRFARKLARTLRGVVFDEQTEELWPAKTQRTPPKPERNEKIDIIDMRWYFLAADQPTDLPEMYLRLARTYLPEALPKRFGNFEPLQGNLERDGDQAFVDICAEYPNDLIFIAGSYPVGLGHLSQGRPASPSRRGWPVGSIAVRMERSVLRTQAWREGAEKFFVELAIASRSFFATAEVLRNHIRKPRGFGMDRESETASRALYIGQWIGVPPVPAWWTWTDERYLPILAPHLCSQTKKFGQAVFHAWADEPLDRDQIAQKQAVAQQPWIPSKYSPTHSGDLFHSEANEIPESIYHGPVLPR